MRLMQLGTALTLYPRDLLWQWASYFVRSDGKIDRTTGGGKVSLHTELPHPRLQPPPPPQFAQFLCNVARFTV